MEVVNTKCNMQSYMNICNFIYFLLLIKKLSESIYGCSLFSDGDCHTQPHKGGIRGRSCLIGKDGDLSQLRDDESPL